MTVARSRMRATIYLVMKTQMGFERFSVSKILRTYVTGGVVARSERFEVWARTHRAGRTGERHTVVGFSVIEILSKEPRKIREVELPVACRSNLDRIIQHLAQVQS
jgi:hypothetical protein